MEKIDLLGTVQLFLGGTLGHLLFHRSGDLGNYLFNNRGEGDTGAGDKGATGSAGNSDKGGGADVKFDATQQKQVDFIVEQRLKREREKYADYEDLRKFRTEYDKQQDATKQKELEEQRKYEDAKKNYESTINQHKELVGKKDQEIRDLTIGHNLMNEINRQNGYVEETTALLKGAAVLDANGNVLIKTKDANGIEVQVPVAEGVKKFLETRPYLVKSTHKGGGGTPPGTPPGGGNEGAAGDHNQLNKEYMDAINRGDFKKSKEIKQKLNQLLVGKGVSV